MTAPRPETLERERESFGMDEAATRLGKGLRWLQAWLREHPADMAGIPHYTPIGRTKEFTGADLDRIRATMRELERCRLKSSHQEPANHLTTTSEERSPDVLLMRLRKRETQKVLRDLRLVSK